MLGAFFCTYEYLRCSINPMRTEDVYIFILIFGALASRKDYTWEC